LTDAESEAAPARRAQALLQAGDVDGARHLLSAALAKDPEDGEAAYLLAVCARYQGDFEAAAQQLQALLAREPENGRALQELAHLARDRGDAEAAIHLYAQALRANPALLASYRQRLQLLEAAGRSQEARLTAAQLREAEALPRPLLAVTDLLAQGRVLKAESLCRQFLAQQPHHPEAMRLLAEVGVRLGALEEANFLLESACELQPDNPRLRIELIRVLGKRQRFETSLAQAQTLLAHAPDNLQYRSIHAIELLQLGRYEEAIAAFDQILEQLPGDAVTLTSRGHALKTCGRSTEAIASYNRRRSSAITARPGTPSPTSRPTASTRSRSARMATLADDPGCAYMDRVYLAFALGKAFEDRGDYAMRLRALASAATPQAAAATLQCRRSSAARSTRSARA
jgi:tetratricopeptide (TPR) repeat protein